MVVLRGREMRMPSLAELMEDYRNWRGRQEWEQGKGWQDFFGGDPRAQEQFEKLSGFGTDAGGLVGMIKASHGSPHAFTKFDFSKIGTGEGAQAYGHGGYFAQGFDSPTAISYRDALGSKNQDAINSAISRSIKGEGDLQSLLVESGFPQERITPEIEKTVRRIISGTDPKDSTVSNDAIKAYQALDNLVPNEGHLYNVELRWPDAAREAADPLGEHHLLDWFEPLSKQSEHVKKSLRDYATLSGKEHYIPEWSDVPVYIGEGISPDTRGKEFYEWLASQPLDIKGLASRELASDTLKAFDVPGIKYWDDGSRGAGKGTRNYVMFDDALANIVSRNGVSLNDLLRR